MQEAFDVKEKAKSNFEGLIHVLVSLARDKKVSIDLIIGAGNTGIAMVKLAEMIFSELSIPIPPKLTLPYHRFTEMHVGEGEPFKNNTLLLPEIVEKLNALGSIQNILFVDDEIGKGRTVKGIAELLLQARPKLSQTKPTLYVVAEDRGYNSQNAVEMDVQYCPFAEGGPIGNAISHIVPPDIHQVMQAYGSLDPKEEINALLDLPIKDKKEEKPVWSYDQLNHMRQNINSFTELQSRFELYLRDLIRKAIPN